jgi:phosphotransferase system enzyme I (PtsP)
MIEVPSLLYELDTLMPRVDFVSVGSNDLLQYLFAADRNKHPGRGTLRSAVGRIPARARRHRRGGRPHKKPLSLCGEMAGRPLEALALIGLGYRAISMAPVSIGPIKSMLLSLDAGTLQRWMTGIVKSGEGSLRAQLKRFAEEQGVEI